jgi:hypothetical protein
MKLPDPVKRFIELNIDFIEQDKWYEVFVNWYTNGSDYYLFELIEALKEAGINIDDYANERKRVIEQMSKYIFEDKLKSSNRITKSDMGESLASDLGLTYDDIMEIFDKVAKDLQLTKAINGWYRL